MASAEWKEIIQDEEQEGSAAGVMKESPAPPSERSGPWAKDHCDYLLDSIDAQLLRLQARGPDARTQGSSGRGTGSLDAVVGTSSVPCETAGSGTVPRWDPAHQLLPVSSAAGHSPKKAPSPQEDLLRWRLYRYTTGRPWSSRRVGPSDASTDEEREALPRLRTSSRWRSGHPRKRPPRGAADPGRKEALRSRCKAAPGAVGHSADAPAEDRLASLVQLEGRVGERRQGLELEEEKLSQKKAQIREADASLYSVPQQKKHVAPELEAFQEALKESRREARRLELLAGANRGQVDEARADLVLLGYKREAGLRELRELEKELSGLRRQCGQYGAAQAEVSRLVTEREGLKDQVRLLEDSRSSLKLQLRTAKAELSSIKETADIRAAQLQEAILSKEQELSRLRGTVLALEAGKQAQDAATKSLKEEHQRQLEVARQEALREKLAESVERAKAGALQEQASTFKKELENLRKTIQERDAELVQQQEAMQQQAKELKQEAEETVQSSLLREQKKWEADARAALQMQREALQEQDRRTRAELQDALEKERKSSRALQDETAGLRERIRELESQARSFQGDKRVAMEELQAVLQKEKAEALRSLREELAQERVQERDQLRARLQRMEEQSETPFLERGSQAQAERADRSLAREIALTCQQLQDLLPKKANGQMSHGSPDPLSSSRALQALQELCEDARCYLQDLKHEAELQRHNLLQIQREKDRELRQQQERLHLESQSALEALKEQLVREHMKDMATLQHGWLKEAGVKEGPTMRHRHLQEKDGELGALRRDTAAWKDVMASGFKEELDTELEKSLSGDNPSDFHRNLETAEAEIGQFSTGWNKYLHPRSVHSPPLNVAPSSGRRSSSTPKLLHHLQSRIRQLQAENATYCRGSLDSLTLSSFQEDLAQAYRSRRHRTPELASSQLHGRSGWQ